MAAALAAEKAEGAAQQRPAATSVASSEQQGGGSMVRCRLRIYVLDPNTTFRFLGVVPPSHSYCLGGDQVRICCPIQQSAAPAATLAYCCSPIHAAHREG